MRARNGISADLIEFGSTYAASKRPCSPCAILLRAPQSSLPWANGSSMTSATCGIARYTGATHGSAATLRLSPRAASRASSGSLITASPIHCGAMTSARVPLVRANDLAGLEPIDRAAVRALGLAGARDVEEHARMAAPQRHLRIRAEDDAVTLKVLGEQLDDVLGLVHSV